jgi:hypothetical protein
MTLDGSAGGRGKTDEAGWGPILIMASGSCGTTSESSAAFPGEAKLVAFDVPVVGVAGEAVALKGAH